MAIDLKKLQEMMNRVLTEETAESFEAFLKDKGYTPAPSQDVLRRQGEVDTALRNSAFMMGGNTEEEKDFFEQGVRFAFRWLRGKYLEPKIDFTDTKQLAEDCWLFLSNNAEQATITKEAFLHEAMLESVKQYSLTQNTKQ